MNNPPGTCEICRRRTTELHLRAVGRRSRMRVCINEEACLDSYRDRMEWSR